MRKIRAPQRFHRWRLLGLYCLFCCVWLLLPVAARASVSLRVGVYDNPPLIYRTDDGSYAGFAVHLLEDIAKQEGWDLVFVHGTFEQGLNRLERAEIDIQPAIAWSEDRAERFDFSSQSIISNWGWVFSRRDHSILSILDLQGASLALLRGDLHASVLRDLIEKFDLHVNYRYVDDYRQMVSLLLTGEVDAGLVNRLFAMSDPILGKLMPTPVIFNPIEVRFAFPREHYRPIQARIDRHLAVMKNDPQSLYYTLLDEIVGGRRTSGLPSWLFPSLAIGVGFGLLLLVLIGVLRQQVKRRTREILLRNEELQQEVVERKSAEKRQEQAAEEASAEKARAEALLAAIGDGISIVDRGYILLYQNDIHRQMFGEQAGKSCHQAVGNCEDLCAGCPVAKTFADGEIHKAEMETRDRQGGRHHLEITSSALRDGTGMVVGGVELIRDATEKRRTENVLRSLVEVTSRTTGEMFFYTLVKHLTTLLGYRFALVGEYIADQGGAIATLAVWGAGNYLDPMVYPLAGTPCEQALALKRSFFVTSATDDRFWDGDFAKAHGIQSYLGEPLLSSGGDRLGVLAVFDDRVRSHDKSHVEVLGVFSARAAAELERIRAEERSDTLQQQLLHSQKMESVGILAGGIAHDFNNLLSSILGYSQLIARRLPADSPFREGMEAITVAGRRAAALTSQLLAFSRKQVLEISVVDVNEVVKGVGKMLGRLIGEDIRLDLDLASGLSSARADTGQIEQILMNLAVNARDAMPQGGVLTVSTSNVQRQDDPVLAADETSTIESWIAIRVTDTGIGMSDDVRERIFEPFYTTKGLGKGTGLGLATVYGIVHQHGGHIYVSSRPGEGSSFVIYLPASSLVPKEEGVCNVEETPGGGETILVVEDDLMVRNFAVDCLLEKGYHVLVAGSGREALQAIVRHGAPIDLLLTDVIMPEMSGASLAEKFSDIFPKAEVLYMSGYQNWALEEKLQVDLGKNFIQKPLTPQALSGKVREILDRRIAPK